MVNKGINKLYLQNFRGNRFNIVFLLGGCVFHIRRTQDAQDLFGGDTISTKGMFFIFVEGQTKVIKLKTNPIFVVEMFELFCSIVLLYVHLAVNTIKTISTKPKL